MSTLTATVACPVFKVGSPDEFHPNDYHEEHCGADLLFEIEVNHSYGTDFDGNRGETRTTVTLLEQSCSCRLDEQQMDECEADALAQTEDQWAGDEDHDADEAEYEEEEEFEYA